VVRPARHGGVTRTFHWLTAVGVAVMVPAGIAMTSEPLAGAADPLYVLHKGLGTILLVVIVARAVWGASHRAPPLPPGVPVVQGRMMLRTHVTLYALLLLQVLSGYVRTVGDGYPIELLDMLGAPTLLPPMPRAAAVALVVHQVTAYALVGLISVHVGVAVHDRWIGGTGIWSRMWPPWSRQ